MGNKHPDDSQDKLISTAEEDIIIFADEEPNLQESTDSGDHSDKEGWEVLIVDDEKQVHQVTKMVLSDFVFDGKKLIFFSAYSAAEAEKLIAAHPNAALMLLDVVMEHEGAGLQFVKYIRDELKNSAIRIILRTGQPGQAPEKSVIMDYDINDYKEKTELTTQKLFTTVVTALRSYRDIKVIEKSRSGLEEIIKSSPTLFELQSMKKFASGVLTQMTSILNVQHDAIHCSYAVTKGVGDLYILAASGDYVPKGDQKARDVVPESVLRAIEEAFQTKQSCYGSSFVTIYFQSKMGMENVIYINSTHALTEWERYMVEIYCANVSVAFENIYLNEELESTQREIIYTMGEITENRSMETGHHVKRVAEYSRLLALKLGLTEQEAEVIHLASPMHDVGKVGIPDAILNKPGSLTKEEFDIMKTHSSLGFEMLKHSQKQVLNAAAIIAQQHHEKYDGNGYPLGLQGDNIHIYGRITAVADVFDALCSDRVYKKAWELERVLELLNKERGRHFDPQIVDIFLENLDEILAIKEKYAEHRPGELA
jgi:response regulator RpfG family c-di-GMP phosphodiesterase